jgi:hypothetical protein
MKWFAARELFKTLMPPEPSVERDRTALFARVCPAEKFRLLVPGLRPLPGYIVKNPEPPETTVAFTEIATADTGMPHADAVTVMSRVAFGCKAGPPKGPFALRVSAIRQGVSV